MSSSSARARDVVTKAEYRDWFDSDGRLVKEARMRQRLFEGQGRVDNEFIVDDVWSRGESCRR